MTRRRPLRVLVVGHGLIGRHRAAALVGLGATRGVELTGTVDPRPPDRHGSDSPPHWPDLSAVPVEAYDAAVVAVPHHLAHGIALAVVRRGRPVLVEKPLGMNVREAQEMERAAAGVALPSFVGFNYRFLPMMRHLLRTTRDGSLGELRSIDMTLGHGGHPGSAEGWKLALEKAGGGVLLDPGVHVIDLTRCLAPRLRPVFAKATDGFWGTGVEEDAVAVMADADLIATLRVSHVRWVNTFRVEVVGTEGYAIGTGRGGTYGPQSLRLGRRWGWNDGSGRTQRETEHVLDLGDDDRSLDDEMVAVVERWLRPHAPSPADEIGPASISDGVAVSEIWEALASLAALQEGAAFGLPETS